MAARHIPGVELSVKWRDFPSTIIAPHVANVANATDCIKQLIGKRWLRTKRAGTSECDDSMFWTGRGLRRLGMNPLDSKLMHNGGLTAGIKVRLQFDERTEVGLLGARPESSAFA